ncbi:uncharacterized protein LOC109599257 isoform X4 [Aethina tumida]|uniref:uncharacterized protein LOC109599257 isoform X4 n=1 Tax=Aethina tumida TaxID=116153 RepID=UPI002147B1EA|nr:uncharacterized protein LOC109599257 isoform X4 [Aethina tumida]
MKATLFVKMATISEDQSDINLLLIGDAAAGKSTLVNAFANYLITQDYNVALDKGPITFAPALYNIEDQTSHQFIVTTGTLPNPFSRFAGLPITQDIKTYSFKIWNDSLTVRLIDTPGFANIEDDCTYDKNNFEYILHYISQRYELHGVCFVMKPLIGPLSRSMVNAMNWLILNLGPRIAKNFIFCFTATREYYYSMGHSERFILETIKEIEKRFPKVKISFDDNIFQFENEPIIYLIARQNNISLNETLNMVNQESWFISQDQCWKLIQYIVGNVDRSPLPPYETLEKRSINDCRRIIHLLLQPMADLIYNFIVNMAVLQRHRTKIDERKHTHKIKDLFDVPIIKLKIKSIPTPVSICTHAKCTGKVQKYSVNVFFCKAPCYAPVLINGQRHKIVGDPALAATPAFDSHTLKCKKCHCRDIFHMYAYYLLEYEIRHVTLKENDNKGGPSKYFQQAQGLNKKIEDRIISMKEELLMLTKMAAEFMFFLKRTTIRDFSDGFAEYINFMIAREVNMSQKSEILSQLRKVLYVYTQAMNTLEKTDTVDSAYATLESIRNLIGRANCAINNIFNLRQAGHYLNLLSKCQFLSRDEQLRSTFVSKYSRNSQIIPIRFDLEFVFSKNMQFISNWGDVGPTTCN